MNPPSVSPNRLFLTYTEYLTHSVLLSTRVNIRRTSGHDTLGLRIVSVSIDLHMINVLQKSIRNVSTDMGDQSTFDLRLPSIEDFDLNRCAHGCHFTPYQPELNVLLTGSRIT